MNKNGIHKKTKKRTHTNNKNNIKEVRRELTSDNGFLDALVDKLVKKIMEQMSKRIDDMKIKISELENKVMIMEVENEMVNWKYNQLEQQTKLNLWHKGKALMKIQLI